MEVEKEKKRNEILHGDALEVLKTLKSKSVNCIVTSPPYYGLRDYGTAKWEGGKGDCNHKKDYVERFLRRGGKPKGQRTKFDFGSSTHDQQELPYKTVCMKCGAIRKDSQLGLEETPQEYVKKLVEIFQEIWRVLRDDGTVWLNLGDSYGDNKNLLGIPWRVAFALQDAGWILRSDIIWSKPNPMPESVTDRPTKSHEYVFLLVKQGKYWYDQEAVREKHGKNHWGKNKGGVTTKYKKGTNGGYLNNNMKKYTSDVPRHPSGRNKRTIWNVATQPYSGAHFAVFPPKLIEPCVKAGCPSRVCVECETPWVRKVEKEKPPENVYTNTTKPNAIAAISVNKKKMGMGQKLQNWYENNPTKTLGFFPQCDCNAPHKPGVVLDPFFGSGTVAHVAIQNGRNWLGIELNEEYINLAKERIRKTQPILPGIE